MDKNVMIRLKKYISERVKVHGIDYEQIHGLHVGDEREAILLLSDIQSISGEITRLQAEVDRTAKIANKYLEEVDNSSAFNRGKIRTVNDIQEKIRREKTTE